MGVHTANALAIVEKACQTGQGDDSIDNRAGAMDYARLSDGFKLLGARYHHQAALKT